MIRDYHYRVFGSSEVMLLFFYGLNSSKEFSVMDIIISFHWRKGSGMVGAGVEVSIGVLLHKYPSGGGEGGIGHDEEWFGRVRHLDHWCR